uniref:(northern house mosquito) hypothetical protein n=1 Tax=Culex pipiens TaxID=7175 RepID=A0A8D8AXD3_CULPI
MFMTSDLDQSRTVSFELSSLFFACQFSRVFICHEVNRVVTCRVLLCLPVKVTVICGPGIWRCCPPEPGKDLRPFRWKWQRSQGLAGRGPGGRRRTERQE